MATDQDIDRLMSPENGVLFRRALLLQGPIWLRGPAGRTRIRETHVGYRTGLPPFSAQASPSCVRSAQAFLGTPR